MTLGKEEKTKKEETATLSNKVEKATSTTKAETVTLTTKEENLVSAFPAKSMFLLSHGKLAEDNRGHRGRVWQCQLCSCADSKRNNVIKQKCTLKSGKHRCYFNEDQLAKLGDHAPSKGGKPLNLPRDSQPAIAQPTPVSTSLCLPLPLLPFLLLYTLLNSGCRGNQAKPWLSANCLPAEDYFLCFIKADGGCNFNGRTSCTLCHNSGSNPY